MGRMRGPFVGYRGAAAVRHDGGQLGAVGQQGCVVESGDAPSAAGDGQRRSGSPAASGANWLVTALTVANTCRVVPLAGRGGRVRRGWPRAW